MIMSLNAMVRNTYRDPNPVSRRRLMWVVAGVLVARGLGDPEEAGAFLAPAVSQLPDPGLLPGMDAASARLADAVRLATGHRRSR